eukprot:CAMPEP_0172521354 /NCGR_PEP_ID=MMETSP1066-20121228/292531_1 /TAXON_ID=671091 /ORGANISM="Coscinodiscus wailesii, Strain CCMP2513" /LENGTH=62 /DNA_ID=CAMNT_0013304261 /DNA_START=1481 /DNA_END=1669 /DNA_ORIENTATION=+
MRQRAVKNLDVITKPKLDKDAVSSPVIMGLHVVEELPVITKEIGNRGEVTAISPFPTFPSPP